jgi:hypothetical protein
MNVREHERVVLTEDIAASGLEAGDVGTVIHVYSDGTACEVGLWRSTGRRRRS